MGGFKGSIYFAPFGSGSGDPCSFELHFEMCKGMRKKVFGRHICTVRDEARGPSYIKYDRNRVLRRGW